MFHISVRNRDSRRWVTGQYCHRHPRRLEWELYMIIQLWQVGLRKASDS
jgi:hypothetical protein